MSLASDVFSGSSSLASGKKIPLTRQRVFDLKSTNGGGSDRKLRQQATAASGSNDVPLINYNSVIYFADITIDTSTFTVLIDTGSSDLWISCAYLSGSTCSSTCPTRSSLIQYGSGNVCIQGTYAKVTIGDVSVNNYVVAIAQGRNVLPTSSTNLLPGGSQGLLGLGYQALATIPTPGGQFIDYLTSFSVYLTDDAYSDGSFLLLNAVDEELIASEKLKAYTIPLKEQAHWTIGMTAFQVGNDTAYYPCSTSSSSAASSGATAGCRSIVDTGTSLLTMPNALFNSFVNTYLVPRGCFIPSDSSTGSSSTSTSSLYVCPKSATLPRLAFTFGNYTFYLEGEEYVIPISQSNYVVVELQPTGSGSLSDTWIIGDTFLKQYYSSYATNQSVTFYCKEGSCTEGSVAATTLPVSGDSNGGSANTSDDSGGSKLSTTATILIVAVAVLGLGVLIIIVSQLRRRRRRAANANAMNAPVQGAYYPGNLTPTGGNGSRGVGGRYYQWKKLADAVDFLFVMSVRNEITLYDMRSQIYYQCLAAANSPLDLVKQGLEEFIYGFGIAPEKLVLGILWYSYKYMCADAGNRFCSLNLTPFFGAPCSDAAGAQVDFGDIEKLILREKLPVQWDDMAQSPFVVSRNESFQIWFDNPRILTLKYQLVRDLGLRGPGMWNADTLNYASDDDGTRAHETQAMWQALHAIT